MNEELTAVQWRNCALFAMGTSIFLVCVCAYQFGQLTRVDREPTERRVVVTLGSAHALPAVRPDEEPPVSEDGP